MRGNLHKWHGTIADDFEVSYIHDQILPNQPFTATEGSLKNTNLSTILLVLETEIQS